MPLEEALRQREARLQELRAKRSEWEVERREQTGELERRLAALEERVAAAEKERDAARARVAELEPDAERAGAAEPGATLLARLAEDAVPVAEALARRIETGIPHRRAERSARVAGILQGLRAPDPLEQGEALEELAAFVEEELRRAGSVELESAPVHLDGGARRVHAWRLRLGLASELFASEDGETLGVASGRAEPDSDWRLDLAPAERAAVRAAVAIRRGQREPELLALPFPLAPAPEPDEEGGSAPSGAEDEATAPPPSGGPDGAEP